jgi:hypothetical protein
MALVKRLNMAFLPIEERKRDMQAVYAWIAGNRRGLKIRIKSVARSTTRSLPRDVVRYYKVLLVAKDQSNTDEALASFYCAGYQCAKSQVFVWLVARCQARAATQARQVNGHCAANLTPFLFPHEPHPTAHNHRIIILLAKAPLK